MERLEQWKYNRKSNKVNSLERWSTMEQSKKIFYF